MISPNTGKHFALPWKGSAAKPASFRNCSEGPQGSSFPLTPIITPTVLYIKRAPQHLHGALTPPLQEARDGCERDIPKLKVRSRGGWVGERNLVHPLSSYLRRWWIRGPYVGAAVVLLQVSLPYLHRNMLHKEKSLRRKTRKNAEVQIAAVNPRRSCGLRILMLRQLAALDLLNSGSIGAGRQRQRGQVVNLRI